MLRIVIVFSFVTLGWLFFKLQDFSQAAAYLQALAIVADPRHRRGCRAADRAVR